MQTVSFTAMKQGTQADYRLLDRYERQHVTTLPDRILDTLAWLGEGLGGYQIDRLQHSLQAATRAENDGADEERVVATLIHDIGDDLAPINHSALAAALIQPYVREEVHWVVEHHGLFQMAYYAHHLGEDPNGRERYRDHPFYQSCLRFCECHHPRYCDWPPPNHNPARIVGGVAGPWTRKKPNERQQYVCAFGFA